MSKSQSNTPYNVKSMNGIITLSDGAGTTIENGEITTNSIDAKGKIKAIQIEANEVLFNDNLDMNNNDILQVNNIGLSTINGAAYPPATADTLAAVLANGNSAGANDINMNSQNITNVTNINGAAYPPTVADNLAAILANGNSAGANDINMNSQNITNVTNINGSAYPPASSVDNLADTLTQGNSAGSTSIDMNSQDLQNVDELQVDNITGRNGVLNNIRLNSKLDVNNKTFENCEAFNFSATTASIFNNNTIQLNAGTVATTGDFDVVLGHSTSEMNITGGDLDMNTNNILNATNITTTTINGSVPATAQTQFFIGNFPYSSYNVYEQVGDLLFGSTTGTAAANRYYVLNDPTSGIGAVATARRYCWTNDPTFKMKVCRTSSSQFGGFILPPGVWNIKFSIGELQTNSGTQQPISWFVDNTNSGTFTDAAGGGRAEQQKIRYRTVRGGGNYHAVPQMDWNVYIGDPNVPETNSGVAKIVGIESAIQALTGFGGWTITCTQLQAFSWAGGYNGFTPSTAASGTIDTAGSWFIRNLND